MATLSALGIMGKGIKVSARERETHSDGLKKLLGKTGLNIFPVVYGGIVSMRDGQPASDNYVSWAVDRSINYFDVAPSYEDAQEKTKGAGVLVIKPLIHRHWKDNAERETSNYPKAWCKPIDTATNKELAIAAIKYTFQSGPDVIIPPGDLKSFSFAVDHIDEILNNPLTQDEKTLLEKEYNEVKGYPFF